MTELDETKKEIIAKLDEVKESLEGMRSQNSAEHGEMSSRMRHVHEMVNWIRAKWERFSSPTGDVPTLKPPKDDK